MPSDEKERRSDIVIVNNGDLADLKREIATKLPELSEAVSS
jgi:dephospho-CoA kinase